MKTEHASMAMLLPLAQAYARTHASIVRSAAWTCHLCEPNAARDSTVVVCHPRNRSKVTPNDGTSKVKPLHCLG